MYATQRRIDEAEFNSSVSKIERVQTKNSGILLTMPLRILNIEKDGEDGIMITFSDGTTAGYVAEELASLRPIREKVEEPGQWNPLQELSTKNI
jgi:hypothetical protein